MLFLFQNHLHHSFGLQIALQYINAHRSLVLAAYAGYSQLGFIRKLIQIKIAIAIKMNNQSVPDAKKGKI